MPETRIKPLDIPNMSATSPIKKLRIASRESALALWQSEHIKSRLENLYPEVQVEIVGMTTKGDKILDVPLAKIGGKGLFVKELETSMLEGETDIAVHSMKDVPMEFPEGLELAAICEREDPFDALVSNEYDSLAALPEGACVGTSSLRRMSQLSKLRPDIQIEPLRGNVNTRLKKLDEGQFDAIILAAAGLKRLGFNDRIKERIPAETCLPSVGQGALGIECRSNDAKIKTLLEPLVHDASSTCLKAERAFNHRLQGGCQVPIAGYATLGDDGSVHLRGLVAAVDGSEIISGEVSGPSQDAEKIGVDLAEQLLEKGAGRILAEIYGEAP